MNWLRPRRTLRCQIKACESGNVAGLRFCYLHLEAWNEYNGWLKAVEGAILDGRAFTLWVDRQPRVLDWW